MSRNMEIAKDSGKGGLVKVHEVVSENQKIYLNLPKCQHYTSLEKGLNTLGKIEQKRVLDVRPVNNLACPKNET